ncbi:MAG: alpha-amylase, partial [Actinobacteria bacterium]|nr:alpha-amylase [Actinomycetota bacterium]
MLPAKTLANSPSDWWRHAVIYQIYPRSFADGNGDGVGDLAGIISRLPAIAELGVDAIWLSPFYRSPQKDAGYDVSDYCDVDPIFGTLTEAETLITTAHDLGLRIIVDVVPNHSSDQHEWFQAALAAESGSPERERYMFRDGHGETGEFPPNNWESVFGGPAWSRTTNPDGSAGQWYLHIFDQSQPDFNWDNPEV